MILSALALYLLSCPAVSNDPPFSSVRKDHGPGTSGGGLLTQSGAVLKLGAVSLSVRLDYTLFERLSETQIRDRTFKVSGDHVHFDAARWTLLESIDVAVGVAEDLQLGFAFGYYRANDLREGHLHGDGSYGFHDFADVSGMTDQWINAKWRALKGPEGSFALFAGVKLPFGDDDEVGEDGTRNEPLEPSLQPGSGAFDVALGTAYSRWLSENVTLDTSVSYTYRTEEDHFKIGDLVLFGIAVAHRFTENVRTFPQPSVFLEANVRHLFRNEEDGERVRNSGGTALFLSPGFRFGFSERASLTLSVQIPVVQALHDKQQETLLKVAMGVTVSL
ncbi:MAG: transporter [Planctomycetes bacterium]|nr:transporter [Planctomycetota bacterium]